MKKSISLIMTLLLGLSYSMAQSPKSIIKFPEVFLTAPDSITPLLTDVNKADLVDFIENNMEASVVNKLSGNTVLKTMTDDFVFLEMSSSSEVLFKILEGGDKTYIMVIKTVKGPMADSRVYLYDLDWKKLPTAGIVPEIGLQAFILESLFKAPNSDELSSLIKLLPEAFVGVQYDGHNLKLEYNNRFDLVDDKVKQKLDQYIGKEVSFVWNGSKFIQAQDTVLSN